MYSAKPNAPERATNLKPTNLRPFIENVPDSFPERLGRISRSTYE